MIGKQIWTLERSVGVDAELEFASEERLHEMAGVDEGLVVIARLGLFCPHLLHMQYPFRAIKCKHYEQINIILITNI